MRIVVYSSLFYPSVGGLETVMYTLACEFARQGHAVKVVTQTPANGNEINVPFTIIRNPSRGELLRLTRWSQLYFQACVTLSGIWPLLLAPRPFFITHHTWYRRMDGSIGWQDRLKLQICKFAHNISISKAIAAHIPAKSYIIPNPYQSDTFKEVSGIARNKELVFLGRLVSDKGADLLLQALAQVKQKQVPFTCTIIGEGPEKQKLMELSRSLGIAEEITFAGKVTGQALVNTLNQHQIMVIPSRWEEPFGVVALEGIACGCVVLGSNGGGLPEAIGSCGLTFANNNVAELSEKILYLLTHREQWADYRAAAAAHLKKHTAPEVSAAYLNVFTQNLNSAKAIEQDVVSVSPQ